MTHEDLLLRRLTGQHLLVPTDRLTAAGDLCGFQAQFLSHAVHALRLRSGSEDVTGLIKGWTLRGTMHLFAENDLPLFVRACAAPEDVCDSPWYCWADGRGEANPPQRERFFARLITDAVASGCVTREALRDLCLREGMTPAEEARLFHPWGGIFAELAQMGVICLEPKQEKAYRLCPTFVPLPAEVAQTEMLRRYFTHYGPATIQDAAYFFRWTQKEIKQAMALLPLTEETLDGRAYYSLQTALPAENVPPCVLLAGFDPLMLGYRKEENPFLPQEYLRDIFSLSGIVSPAILLRGQVAGRWKRRGNRLELTAFRSLSAADRRCVEDSAAVLWPLKTVEWL